jgi:hypothetical protein
MRFFLIAFFISASAFAETCSLALLHGSVRIIKTDMLLVVAEKTQSEKKLPVYFKTQARLSPYIDHYVQLKAILDKKKILYIEEVKDVSPDPLNRNAATEINKVKKVKCPSL